MDKYWENAEHYFQINNKKHIIIGYAISLICIALGILFVGKSIMKNQYFSCENMELPLRCMLIGISGICMLFFRKRTPVRVKFYIACLLFTIVSAYMLVFHPNASTRQFPYPKFNRGIDIVGCAFFGGLGLWIAYNDYRWYKKKDSKEKKNRDFQN